MVAIKKSDKRVRKEAQWEKIQKITANYKNVLFVNVDNVSSTQINEIRRDLREIGAVLFIGKSTLTKAALNAANTAPAIQDKDFVERQATWAFNDNIPKIVNELNGNTNLIFTNGDLGEVKFVLDNCVRKCPAKAGMVAPCDVFIPAGKTGLDPKKTKFFQTLDIPTKIVATQIDIIQEQHIIKKGAKVDGSQAALLDLLKIHPFEYKINIKKVLIDGNVYDAGYLNLTTDNILAKFRKGIENQACLSLGAGHSTTASAPHSILKGFMNLVSVAIDSGFSFSHADNFIADMGANNKAEVPVKSDVVEVLEVVNKEEDEPVNFTGLFDDDEYGDEF